MKDTQWPRYEVFQQARPGRPHKNVGSVHAPDPEMALCNGRDVFGRRPQSHNLWVIPANQIFSKTAEELATAELDDSPADAAAETYLIFQKTSHKRRMTYVTHVGEVEAASPAGALQKAREQFGDDGGLVWWVCPARAVTRSSDEDVDSMFAPANDKKYRLPNQYHTVRAMRKIKHAEEQKDDA